MHEDAYTRNMQKVGHNRCNTMSADEATDAQNNSMLALFCRTTSDYFDPEQVPSGIYKIKYLKTETLFVVAMISFISRIINS